MSRRYLVTQLGMSGLGLGEGMKERQREGMREKQRERGERERGERERGEIEREERERGEREGERECEGVRIL